MDISCILNHTKELMELRGEETELFQEEVDKIDLARWMDEWITVPLKYHRLFFVLSKDSFKELWAAIRNLSVEDMERMYQTKKFIVILGDYPPSITLQALQQKDQVLSGSNGFLQLFLARELMYNPSKHFLVPKHEKMSDSDVQHLMEELQLKNKTQLPFIQKSDKMARWLGLKPGDVVKITRYSETSGEYFYYRTCI